MNLKTLGKGHRIASLVIMFLMAPCQPSSVRVGLNSFEHADSLNIDTGHIVMCMRAMV